MKTQRRKEARAALFVLAMTASAGAVFVACSGDDSTGASTVQDSGTTNDATTGADTGSKTDASARDATADANEGGPECTSAPDAAMYGLDAIDAGGQVVTARGCHGCHTADLSGSTSTVGGFAYPKNLTPDLTNGLGCWTDEEIARAILTGIDDQGEQLCVMPQFQGVIDDAGVSEVVAYLRSIPAVDKVIPETACPTDAGEDAD